MHVAVTGGCGYIGSVLVPLLAEKGYSVDVIDTARPSKALMNVLTNLSAKQKVEFHSLDVANYNKWKQIAPRYDVIVHLAALVGYPACNENPEKAIRCNVSATTSVLRAKRKDARVLLSSTSSNYGTQTGKQRVTETTPLNPNSIYGTTKVRAEELVLLEPHNIVYRFAGGFGYSYNTRNDLLIHDFLSKALLGASLSVYESHFTRQFIHVRDMAAAIHFAITNWNRLQGNVYNVGNPNIELTKRQLVETLAKHLEFEYRFEASGTDAEKRHYALSFEKIIKAGFKPQMSLKHGIEELIQYYTAMGTKPTKQARENLQAA